MAAAAAAAAGPVGVDAPVREEEEGELARCGGDEKPRVEAEADGG